MAQTATADPAASPIAPPSSGTDSGFDEFLKNYHASLEKSGAASQAAYGEAGAKLSELHKQEDALQPPPPPAPAPPPQEKNTSPVEEWGSIAMAVATLGSAMTRQPMTNALNAAGRVMQAYKQRDDDTFNRELAEWHTQTDYALKLHEYQNERYKEALDKIRGGEQGALDELKIELGATGDQQALKVLELRGQEGLQKFLSARDKQMQTAATKTDQAFMAGVRGSVMLAWAKKYNIDPNHPDPNHPPTAEQLHELHTDLMAVDNKDEKAGKIEQLEVKTPDGKTSEVAAEQGAHPGQWFSAVTGKQITFPEGSEISVKPPSSGRQAAAQITSMVNAGNEVAASLQNLVELPVAATGGWYMGVQSMQPDDLKEALHRSLVSTLTADDTKSLLVSFSGVSRAMATLEAAGRATGLVGLTHAASLLMPQEGDNGLTVLRKYGEIRQLTERSIETVKASPGVSDDQKQLLDQIVAQVKEAVPWTVHDINNLEHNPSDETVATFAKKLSAGAAGAGGKAAPDHADRIQNGWLYKWQNGKYEPVERAQ